ncbi:MAG: TIGR04149 family rSAM-modified RiPP [Bacteroidales bacterium]|nr:TIGR04149 family rSAM-modified RiPP [Bacteroidales bacterium]
MKRKIKLTDLRHVETSKEEMNHIKGGEEMGPLCWGCKCVCECSNENIANTNATNNGNSARNNGSSSWWIDVVITVVVGGFGRLL